MTHSEQWKKVVERNKNDIQYQCSTQFLPNEKYFQEFKLFKYMALWKETFCKDYEPNWEDNATDPKYYIVFRCYTKKYWITTAYRERRNMQVYLPTWELTEQMLQDLKDVGVIKE